MTNQPGIRDAAASPSATDAARAPSPDADTATPTAGGAETLDTTATPPETSAPGETHQSREESHADDAGDDDADDADADDDADDDDADEAAKASAEEFAHEHDPATHDVAAGEESRQRGDWTAEEAGGPQVWDAEGNLVDGTSPAQPPTAADQSAADEDGAKDEDDAKDSHENRRTSSLDEVRDGGYSVGSAAPIDDGAVPLGHPVKAWEDTKTFAAPDHPSYPDAEPDLWFTDDGAAQRAGFRPVD